MISNTIKGDGKTMVISGQVFDGNAEVINDAMIEIWQADGSGQYDQRGFCGFARSGTGFDEHHRFVFETIKPGSSGPDEAPYISVIVFMRGLMMHVYTRLYFSDEQTANEKDHVLAQLPVERRHTLIAMRQELTEELSYVFDIHMQGDKETVFFDI